MYETDNVEQSRRYIDEVKSQRNHLDQLLLSIPAPQVVIDGRTLRIIHANEAFGKKLGYTHEDIIVEDFSFGDVLCDAQSQRFLLQLQEVSKDETAGDKYLVYDLKTKDGNCHSYFVYAYPIKDGKEAEPTIGNTAWYNVLILPSPTKGLIFVSAEARELLAEQFAGEAFGTFEWFIDADTALWSDGVYDIFEVTKSKKDINRAFVRQFTHPDDMQKAQDMIMEAMQTGLPAQIEFRVITADKNEKIVHCLVKCIMNNEGRVVKLVGSIKDVTQKRAEEDNIQKRVEDLNRSNKELEEFAYVASHDMQEPLRKISTFTDRLNDKYADVLTGDGAMYLDRVMASAESMRQLINNLLEFSRISKSTQPFSPVNLGFVLHQVKADLELTIEETGTVINSAPLPTIEGSISQLKQLFDNIINNAIKFRRADTAPVINIEANVLSKEDKAKYGLKGDTVYHKIQITDNGIGFEKEYAAHIFQVFQRLHGKSEYPGSGIGLAICKKILEHHHGLIFADSAEGQGAHFVFILPEKQST